MPTQQKLRNRPGKMSSTKFDPMEVRFSTSKKDYQNLWTAVWVGGNKRNPYAWGYRTIACVMLVCLLIGLAMAVQSDWSIVEEFEPKAYWGLVWFVAATAHTRLIARTHLWDHGLLLQEHFVRIGAGEIETGSERAYGRYSWSSVLEVFVHKQLLLFRLDGAMFIYVPRSAFDTDEKFEAFEQLARKFWEHGETGNRRVSTENAM
jgi:YcxB-like protein